MIIIIEYDKAKKGDFIVFNYIDVGGTEIVKKAIIKEFFFGTNKYLKCYLPMIKAFDTEDLCEKTFLVKNMDEIKFIEI